MVKGTAYFEEAFDSGLSFYAYRSLYELNGSRFGRIFSFSKKLSDRKLLHRKYHETGYSHFFKIVDVKKAYRLRLCQAVELEKSGEPSIAAKASAYLDIVNDKEVVRILELPGAVAEYLDGRKPRTDLFENRGSEKKKTGGLIFCGPSADVSGVDFSKYQGVVLNKPIPLEHYGICGDQVILVLNNIWSLTKRNEIVAWAAAHKGATIFAPNRIGLDNEINDAFAGIPKFPFGSFMGLQRALSIIMSRYEFDRVDLVGFDFSLSQTAYRPWYPSLILNQYGSHEEAFMDTYRKHDFLLNFMYVEKLVARNLVSGSVIEYTGKGIGRVMSLFEEKLRMKPRSR